MLDDLSTDSFLSRLAAIVGAKNVLTDLNDTALYLAEPRELFHGKARCVVRPGSTEEVAAVLKLCAETNTSVVPQGGNTGLVGGQIPGQEGRQNEVLLSLKRMDRIREIDPASMTMTVEAGLTLLRVQEEAEKAGGLFPLSLASEGSCTIGGNLATNAGGTAVLAYGNARDLVSGLEVVLADGRVLSNLSNRGGRENVSAPQGAGDSVHRHSLAAGGAGLAQPLAVDRGCEREDVRNSLALRPRYCVEARRRRARSAGGQA